MNLISNYNTLLQELEGMIGGEDIDNLKKVITFNFINQDEVIIIYSDKIEYLLNRGRKVVYEFEILEYLVFAKFIKVEG